MKRIMVLVLAMVLTLSLCACKTTEEVVSEYSEENTTISTSSDSGEADTDVGDATNTAKKTTVAGTIKKTAVRVTTTTRKTQTLAPQTKWTKALPPYARDIAELGKIVDAIDTHFVLLENGDVYQISLDGKFSATNKHYRKVNSDIKFKRMFRAEFVKWGTVIVLIGENDKVYWAYLYELESFRLTPGTNEQVDLLLEYERDSRIGMYVNGNFEYDPYYFVHDNSVYLKGQDAPVVSFPAGETVERVTPCAIETNKGCYQLRERKKDTGYVDIIEYEIVLSKVDVPAGVYFVESTTPSFVYYYTDGRVGVR